MQRKVARAGGNGMLVEPSPCGTGEAVVRVLGNNPRIADHAAIIVTDFDSARAERRGRWVQRVGVEYPRRCSAGIKGRQGGMERHAVQPSVPGTLNDCGKLAAQGSGRSLNRTKCEAQAFVKF